jgi:hypothetical protein
VLATGKRPYVLVDLYGEMNALPKLIDDRAVRTKDPAPRAGFPVEAPSVDKPRRWWPSTARRRGFQEGAGPGPVVSMP